MTVQVILDRALDANGDPLSGALAYTYTENTTTPVATYQNVGLTTAHTNPIVADSEGRFAQAFHSGIGRLKVVYKTSAGSTIKTEDPAKTVLYDGSSAEQISYDGSGSGLGASTAQAAIDQTYSAITDTTANAQTVTATGGSSNVYTLTAASTVTAYAAGQEFLIRINHANSGAATLNVDSLGAVSVKKYDGAGSLTDLVSGDLNVDDILSVFHDGTRFILRTPVAILGKNNAFTGTNTFASVVTTGNGLFGKSTVDQSVAGVEARSTGFVSATVDGGTAGSFNRLTSDGTVVSIKQDTTEEGSISVSGTTVSYNNFLGAHYSELDGAPADLLPGTVVEATGNLVTDRFDRSGRLTKFKVSDKPGSASVYGVILGPDYEQDSDGHDIGEKRDKVRTQYKIAALGAGLVRVKVAESINVGDLLESAGDGTAQVQADDLIRSRTIGKVTSAEFTETFSDGTGLIACVLYCG